MDKLTNMLTDELDLQPSPPTPDPPDVGENKKNSRIETPDATQPTPPSKETLNQIPQYLRDNVVKSQEESQGKIEIPLSKTKPQKPRKWQHQGHQKLFLRPKKSLQLKNRRLTGPEKLLRPVSKA